jgi:hypothetical protein
MNEKRIRNRFLSTLLLILAVVFFSKEPVWGADKFVKDDGSGTSCTRAFPCDFTYAIDNALPGDHIIFKEGTYKRTASSVLRITKEFYLYGGWNGFFFGDLVINPELYPSILDGENLRPVIVILGPINTIISGFTIQNGNAKDLPAQTIVCEGAMATGCGGGIYIGEAKALIASNKILKNQANEGKGMGGGVHLERASGSILLNNLIQDNQARVKGGGLYMHGSASTPLIIQGNHLIHNSVSLFAEAGGGAIGFFPGTNPTIQDNVFDNNSGAIGAGILGLGSATITRNLFQNHTGFYLVSLGIFHGGKFESNRLLNNNISNGLLLGESLSPIISNNVIARSGLEYALKAGAANAVIEHNTLVGENIGTAIWAKSSTPLGLNNNIISGYPIGIDAAESPGIVTARHTLFDSSVTTQGINVTVVNPLVGDPAFKDPAANDFHIKLTSAARDAGTANFITTTQDIDGDPRIIGSAPDIGADEYKDATYLYLPLIKK